MRGLASRLALTHAVVFYRVIAIDGPAASGRVVSRRVGCWLDFVYVNSGAM
jgi:cytidylate kinase